MSQSNAQQFLQSLLDRLTSQATVQKVYGEPIVSGDKTVIPVAKVILSFGGGYGEGKGATKKGSVNAADSGQGEGGGVGGGLIVEPAGFVEITPARTRYVPVRTGRYVAIGVALGLMLSKVLSRRR
ncbi:spore germination protein GerW family protein [Spirosoma fluminis]